MIYTGMVKMTNNRFKKFFCFGNPLVKSDSLPIILIPELKKEFPNIEFIEAERPEDIEGESEINIIDTAEGIGKVCEIELDKIEEHKCCSLHDFDLAMSLKLMKKMGRLGSLRIIGIPKGYAKKKALFEVSKLLSNSL